MVVCIASSFFFSFPFPLYFFEPSAFSPIAIRFRVCTRHVGGRARPENFPIRSVLGVIQHCPCIDGEAFEGCRPRWTVELVSRKSLIVSSWCRNMWNHTSPQMQRDFPI